MEKSNYIEEFIINSVSWLRLAVETIGAVIIAAGILVAAYAIIKNYATHQLKDFNKIRLVLGRYLALALEFQLGADILSTAIAPSWEQIGKLGAIAVIRTGLNYFLMKEVREEAGSTGKAEAALEEPETP
ncbi:MAG: DUF1622 domain-containing protein [Acidobacteriota bacterium]